MGLDITAYERVTPIHADPDDESVTRLYVDPAFPGRADGIQSGAALDDLIDKIGERGA